MGFVGKLRDMFTEYDDEYDEQMEDAPEIDDFDQIKRESAQTNYDIPPFRCGQPQQGGEYPRHHPASGGAGKTRAC